MENTLENKQRFFALYWGQEVFNNGFMSDGGWYFTGSNYDEINSPDIVILKPLSSITDEDLLKCYHLHSEFIGYDYTMDFNGLLESAKFWLNSSAFKDFKYNTILSDYLRSKGYALPWMGLSVEKQIKYGWIKLNYENSTTK